MDKPRKSKVLLARSNGSGNFQLRPDRFAKEEQHAARRGDAGKNGVEAVVAERALAEVKVVESGGGGDKIVHCKRGTISHPIVPMRY